MDNHPRVLQAGIPFFHWVSFIIMPHLCAVYGCGNNSKREKGIFQFFRFPAISLHQGEETKKLTEERRRQWHENLSHQGNFNWFNWGDRITHKFYSFSSTSPATLFL